jgi:hypothetical protein
MIRIYFGDLKIGSNCLYATLCVVPTAERLVNFKTWLSNTPPTVGTSLQTSTCTLCRQYPGFFPASVTAYFNCPLTLPAFQYVIIQGSWGSQPICMEEVRVYTGQLSKHGDVLNKNLFFLKLNFLYSALRLK